MAMKWKILFSITLLLSTVTACSVRQELTLNLDSSGKIELTATLEPVFVNYLFDIAEATTEIASPDDLEIFNISEIKAALEKQPGVKVTRIFSPAKASLFLELQLADLAALSAALKKEGSQPLLSFREVAGTRQFAFHLAKANYRDLKALFPLLENPAFENFEPQPDEDITTAEYLDVVEFTMDAEGRRAVQAALLEVNVKVAGKIISWQGGTKQEGGILVRIPLLDVLLLNKPVEFSVQFK